LALLIDEYEKKNFPIEAPDPIEAIKIRMEEMDLKQ
jgi:HTH-type transcriptional regulator/antitoxin HigA